MFQRTNTQSDQSTIGRKISKVAGSAGDRVSDFASGQSDNVGWIVATVLAFALGFLGGVLIAPRSGRETRKNIGEKAKDVSSVVTRRRLKSAPEVPDDTEEVP